MGLAQLLIVGFAGGVAGGLALMAAAFVIARWWGTRIDGKVADLVALRAVADEARIAVKGWRHGNVYLLDVETALGVLDGKVSG